MSVLDKTEKEFDIKKLRPKHTTVETILSDKKDSQKDSL